MQQQQGNFFQKMLYSARKLGSVAKKKNRKERRQEGKSGFGGWLKPMLKGKYKFVVNPKAKYISARRMRRGLNRQIRTLQEIQWSK